MFGEVLCQGTREQTEVDCREEGDREGGNGALALASVSWGVSELQSLRYVQMRTAPPQPMLVERHEHGVRA